VATSAIAIVGHRGSSEVTSVEVEDTTDGTTKTTSELRSNEIGNKVCFSFDPERGREYRIAPNY